MADLTFPSVFSWTSSNSFASARLPESVEIRIFSHTRQIILELNGYRLGHPTTRSFCDSEDELLKLLSNNYLTARGDRLPQSAWPLSTANVARSVLSGLDIMSTNYVSTISNTFLSELKDSRPNDRFGLKDYRTLGHTVSEQLQNEPANFATLAVLLRHCGKAKALYDGRRLHAFIKECGYEGNTYLGNCLVQMYGKCGSLKDAREAFHDILRPDAYSWNILFQTCVDNGYLDVARNIFYQMPQRNIVSWNAMIAACAQTGRSKEALHHFSEMQLNGIRPDKITFLSALDACARLGVLKEGQEVHYTIFDCGYEPDAVMGTALIYMYAQCRDLDQAKNVFNRVHQHDVGCWSAMIAACAENGNGKEALFFLHQMQQHGTKANEVTFLSILNACTDLGALEDGQKVHALLVEYGYEKDVVVGTALVNMYGKCGMLNDAKCAFTTIYQQDVVSWNAMISANAQNGNGKKALDLLFQMGVHGIKPDQVTFICALDACSSMANLKDGQDIHVFIVDSEYARDIVVGNALVSMYGRCRSLVSATSVFRSMPDRNVISWNAISAALVQNSNWKEALDAFQQMQLEGIKPNRVTFICALGACTNLAAIQMGHEIFASIVDSGYERDVVLGTLLVGMYGKCGNVEAARRVFDRMPQLDVFSWNAMITACSQNGHYNEALELFHQVLCNDAELEMVTFVIVLDVCARLADLKKGQEVHALIVCMSYGQDISVSNSLVNMYGKCGNLDRAWCIFNVMFQKDVVSWNAMIMACAGNGHGEEALDLFCRMHLDGIEPNRITFISVLDACGSLEALAEGQNVHAAIIDSAFGFEHDVVVGTALISMYGKCRSVYNARCVFDRMPVLDVVSWSAMISVCVQNGRGEEALDLFHQMQLEAVMPNKVALVCALDACASLAAFKEGKEVHALIISCGLEREGVLGNALINMYGKCGSMDDARNLFGRVAQPNIVTWTAMMAAYAQNGHFEDALDLFFQMQANGVKPNNITFICMLSACSHAGQVDYGKQFFKSMKRDYDLKHSVEHYMCMIDLLGRAGHLDEAEDLIDVMPFKNATSAWSTLLNACKTHGDAERGSRAGYNYIKMDPTDAAPYIALSNIYAAAA